MKFISNRNNKICLYLFSSSAYEIVFWVFMNKTISNPSTLDSLFKELYLFRQWGSTKKTLEIWYRKFLYVWLTKISSLIWKYSLTRLYLCVMCKYSGFYNTVEIKYSNKNWHKGNRKTITHFYVIIWKCFSHYWPLVRGIHRSSMESILKDAFFYVGMNKLLNK